MLNTGDEENPIRRLVSTFLSPLATAYVLVVVLLYLVARRPNRWSVAAAAIAYAGLLWTHTRAAYLALALGLVVLAAAQRRWLPVGLAVASLVVGVGFVKAFPHIGPSTSYTQAELAQLRAQGSRHPDVSNDPLSGGDASTSSHLRNLRDGIRTVLEHPQGFGLGNSGVSASRTGGRRQSRRVDLHRARRRHGPTRGRRARRLAGRRARGVVAALGLADGRVGGDACDRHPDRCDRSALDRLRRVRAGGHRARRRPAGGGAELTRLAARIGYFRVAALLVGGALVLEVVRTQALAAGSVGRVACTVGEIAFIVAAAVPFLTGMRARGRS